jgi:hypothetical protein
MVICMSIFLPIFGYIPLSVYLDFLFMINIILHFKDFAGDTQLSTNFRQQAYLFRLLTIKGNFKYSG